jgi:hypothetical protein
MCLANASIDANTAQLTNNLIEAVTKIPALKNQLLTSTSVTIEKYMDDKISELHCRLDQNFQHKDFVVTLCYGNGIARNMNTELLHHHSRSKHQDFPILGSFTVDAASYSVIRDKLLSLTTDDLGHSGGRIHGAASSTKMVLGPAHNPKTWSDSEPK